MTPPKVCLIFLIAVSLRTISTAEEGSHFSIQFTRLVYSDRDWDDFREFTAEIVAETNMVVSLSNSRFLEIEETFQSNNPEFETAFAEAVAVETFYRISGNDIFVTHRSEPSFLGSLRIAPYWYQSPIIGQFNLQFFPWLYVVAEDRFWYITADSNSGNIFYYDVGDEAWHWTAKGIYPQSYNFGEMQWE